MNVSAYVGLPWSPTFTCWDLVRKVQRERFGREVPQLEIGDPAAQERVLLQMVGEHGVWRRTLQPRAGDIMSCRGLAGPHVGVMVSATRVLHNVGSRERPGSVRRDRIADLALAGFQRVVYWSPNNE